MKSSVDSLALRLSGVVDFPVYDSDREIGYVLRPNQSGTFLQKNAQVVNDQSMSTTKWAPNGSRDLLLIGDSVVLGGNPLTQG